jgi:heat-inducible transcriptional repressor
MPIGDAYINIDTGERLLTEREQTILSAVIQLYILNASPVGSRNLSKHLEKELKLSPATIRNVMADLEELDYISHPHTSAGRAPTDKGYRFYVNKLMGVMADNESNIISFDQEFDPNDGESMLKEAGKALGMLAKCLSVVRLPYLSDLVVRRADMIRLSSDRILVIVEMDSNVVRTMALEINFDVSDKHISRIADYINEKISGKKLSFLLQNFLNIADEFPSDNAPLLRLFVDSVFKLFKKEQSGEKLHLAGAQNLISQPEFDDIDKVRGVVELIENEDFIVHILDKADNIESNVKVLIGAEMDSQMLEDYSLVSSTYQFSGASGSIGLIGPKRMNYSKIINLVQSMSQTLSNK